MVAHESHALLSYYILFGAMCVWGVVYAVVGGPIAALLADSTPTQGRAWYYTKLNQINLVASALGPVVAIVMLLQLGNTWDILDLRNVMCAGLFIQLPMFIPMLFFRDRYTLGEESDPMGIGRGRPR